jgi:hypothetical protein
MITQSLKVIPKGMLQSGSASIIIDDKTGVGSVRLDLDFGMWGITAYHEHDDLVSKIDLNLLLSSSIKEGLELGFKGLKIKFGVVSQTMGLADVHLSAPDLNLAGAVQVSLKEQYISVTRLTLSGIAKGFNVDLEMIAK